MNKQKASLLAIIILLVVLTIPSFWRMLRPGIFSMHDFHIFRLYEFNRCIRDWQIPCRWAPDSGFEYGEPMFNFYGQLLYIPGEIFHLLGFQIIDSIKLLFILSLIGSAITMFFLAKQLWGSVFGGLISAILYLYAPYRAVDVWARGALPEATAFVLFPAILYQLNAYFWQGKRRNLLLFSLFLAILAGTHNLSLIMFLVFLGPWTIFLLWRTRKFFLIKHLAWASVLSVALIAFYLLPLAAETKLITLGKTAEGYYDYRAHFTTLNQLFISRFWGYGASLWGPIDDMSFSVGHLQWTFPLLVVSVFVVSKKAFKKHFDKFLALIGLTAIGWFVLFLTHGRSIFIWNLVPFFAFIQFPWRWLSIAVFSLSLAAGAVFILFKKKPLIITLTFLLFLIAVLWNFEFFQEDLWFYISDLEQFSGSRWEEQIASAVHDFWPIYGEETPNSPASKLPIVARGEAEVFPGQKDSWTAEYKVLVESDGATIQLPIAFFPGWQGSIDGDSTEIIPSGKYGLITFQIPKGKHEVSTRFSNTPIRTVGNLISVLALIAFILLFVKGQNIKDET